MCGLLDPLEMACLATFVDNGVNIFDCLFVDVMIKKVAASRDEMWTIQKKLSKR